MCKFIFTLSLFCSFITAFSFLLLDRLLGLVDHAAEFARQLLELLVFQFLQLYVIIVNVVVYLLVDPLVSLYIFGLSVLFFTSAYSQFSFKFIDLLSIFLLVFDRSLGASGDFTPHLFILFLHSFDFFLKVEVFVIPHGALDIVLIHYVLACLLIESSR